MKYAVLSDIHGNLEALHAVWDDLEKQRPDKVLCLGDMVGYGPDPQQVVDHIRQHEVLVTLGNHEHALADAKNLYWFNPQSRHVVELTRNLLSEQTLAYFHTLPRWLRAESSRFTHAAPPDNLHVYLFASTDQKLINRFERFTERLCFTGHTHRLELISYDQKTLSRHTPGPGIHYLDEQIRYIINSGSVGQPRDRDNRARYVLYDEAQSLLEIRAVDYDRDTTAKKIRALGFPEVYARRLYSMED